MAKKRKTRSEGVEETAETTSRVVLIDEEETKSSKMRLTKREFNARRQHENKLWQLSNRIGLDANMRYKAYYQTQLPFLQEEWEAFHRVMSSPLPVTLRLNSSRMPFSSFVLRSRLEDFNRNKGRFIEVNGEVVHQLISPITFLPLEKLEAYQINVDSKSLVKNESLKDLSDYLLRESALGHVVRQELVSMIPALALEIQSHHHILDMCAAPGSKTEQLLSLLYSSNQSDGEMAGMVVANDSDPKRIATLRKRYSKCGSPHLLITCARAEDIAEHIGAPTFDRIVCDVPCTGDGTFRKFPHQWRLFRPRFGFEIHELQLQIALAAASLLKPGGRMVYSTCSLNPLENEAVVAALLSHYKGGLQLVDPRAMNLFPSLVYRQGLSSWRCDADLLVVGEVDVSERAKTLAKAPKIVNTMMPPSAEAALEMHLERCMRIMPHDQNTGGFFVAVLEMKNTNASKQHAKKLSSTESLKALRQLGFNPTLANPNADMCSDHRGVTALYGVHVKNDMYYLENVSAADQRIPSFSLERLSQLGLDPFCGNGTRISRIFVRPLPLKPAVTPKLAVIAEERSRAPVQKAIPSEAAGVSPPYDVYEIYFVSESVARAISSWANAGICAQAGVALLRAQVTSTPENSTPLPNDLHWNLNPDGVQSVIRLLNHLVVRIPCSEMTSLLSMIASSVDAGSNKNMIECPFQISELIDISPTMFKMIDSQHFQSTGIISVDLDSVASLHSKSESAINASKKRISRAERKKLKRNGCRMTDVPSTPETAPKTSMTDTNLSIKNPPEPCLVFEIDSDAEAVTFSISKDACLSYLHHIQYYVNYTQP